MFKTIILAAALAAIGSVPASAQAPVSLSSYADAKGFIDVQALTCAQLAGTFQEDADALSSWYSGWYNGLAKKHFLDFKKGRETEHELIVYCKANPGKKIIEGLAVVFKDERAKLGIELK
ncbi:HdeA/HdeB family chaperone [Microvirga antarctica]|uniref:HdeA/HdeB family chaperone n=1 Tax=Microvirga antarctica TaxID=2819233 RepID=UPI001B30C4E0|nr:HdeA/HdeB family chaperone [Microvirga antarctica]